MDSSYVKIRVSKSASAIEGRLAAGQLAFDQQSIIVNPHTYQLYESEKKATGLADNNLFLVYMLQTIFGKAKQDPTLINNWLEATGIGIQRGYDSFLNVGNKRPSLDNKEISFSKHLR
ncbi:hypothetical protein EB796_016071 [Bugula neritina]|uniref:Uncharacterized protein n=1 Tax=Bugula neritina TaxID=10212 RepID=A0A7J7JJD4_BUGNE|nr:hypothetical protein EB796_016071 [Bugula neritina]